MYVYSVKLQQSCSPVHIPVRELLLQHVGSVLELLLPLSLLFVLLSLQDPLLLQVLVSLGLGDHVVDGLLLPGEISI